MLFIRLHTSGLTCGHLAALQASDRVLGHVWRPAECQQRQCANPDRLYMESCQRAHYRCLGCSCGSNKAHAIMPAAHSDSERRSGSTAHAPCYTLWDACPGRPLPTLPAHPCPVLLQTTTTTSMLRGAQASVSFMTAVLMSMSWSTQLTLWTPGWWTGEAAVLSGSRSAAWLGRQAIVCSTANSSLLTQWARHA